MSYYDDNAAALFRRYLDVKSNEVHRCWSEKLPAQSGLACDIGAGSGRDAVWLASLGWDVVAVEPSRELRTRGEQYTLEQQRASGSVSWIADALPELKRLRALDQRFQLILLSAVWMHLPPAQHERAMRIISELLAPCGIVVISLRHGPDEAGRFHRVSADELIQHAHNRALIKQHDVRGVPDLTRQEVHWDYLLFQLPDDGTGSLPLSRHIIVNDSKTASYKLGLLRTLVRIAEGYPGMVTRRTEDRVEIPFGLVGLFWLKIYMPLVLTHNLIQTPKADHAKQRGYGWAKADHFYSLQDLSPYDLRVGATFYGDTARRLIGAIRDACTNIKKNPAHFTTYPGSDDFVFNCEIRGFRYNSKSWQITRESLQKFGTFSIPLDLWQSFSQYGCWIEPAIIMSGFA